VPYAGVLVVAGGGLEILLQCRKRILER